jgi:putative tryptophan/tyrosine transport system substrate-binding protein
MIGRRDFITLLGGIAAARPLPAQAQQAAVPVIGILSGATFEIMNDLLAWVYPGLADQGYVESRNFTVQLRWADDVYDRLPALAADLVRRRVDLIFALGTTPGALAAKAATQTIPIVFLVGTDPVDSGLVPNLARPDGNLTGVTILVVELLAKNLSLMHELMPSAGSIAVLINPGNRTQAETELRDVQAAARILGVRLVILNASMPSEIEAAFATLMREGAGGLVVSGESFFYAQREQLIALAGRYAVPAIYPSPSFFEAGGLMAYGASQADLYRQAGVYVGRVLKGEKPADLPVQRATKLNLALNLKAAKALGITVPTSILLRADEVIE